MSERAYVAFLLVHLHFPDAGSLKGKRSELKSIKAALQNRLHAAVAEVGHQDTWQRATLAAAVCAGSARQADESADAVERWLDAHLPQGVRVERRLASWSDLGAMA